MTRNIRAIANHRETRPFQVSILEMWVVIAINSAGLAFSLLLE